MKDSRKNEKKESSNISRFSNSPSHQVPTTSMGSLRSVHVLKQPYCFMVVSKLIIQTLNRRNIFVECGTKLSLSVSGLYLYWPVGYRFCNLYRIRKLSAWRWDGAMMTDLLYQWSWRWIRELKKGMCEKRMAADNLRKRIKFYDASVT